VASTEKWKLPKGEKQTAFQVFRAAKGGKAGDVIRGIGVRSASDVQVSEYVLKYKVLPAAP
jgi:hypothetical protein